MLFVAFNIFSLSLIFVYLINMGLIVLCLWFILYGTLCASWTWVSVSLLMLEKFPAIISSNIFSGCFSLSPPSGTSLMWMLVCSMLSQRSPRHFFSFFFLYFVPQQRFPSLWLPAHLLVLLPHLFCYLFLSNFSYCSFLYVH